jgi:DNA-binding NtrC family response regulator
MLANLAEDFQNQIRLAKCEDVPASPVADAAQGGAAPAPEDALHRLVGQSEPMLHMVRMIERVAPTDATVFIVGESGSGKELIACTIHEKSRRTQGPFLAVNCGAIPHNLIEAELFGYEKGSFTGATRQHHGYFERAEGGTLFLDEITEMPLEMQVRLLRVLETGRVTRVGGTDEFSVNVRILAATNRNPSEAVREGRLREDLLYRLSVFPIDVPPLRARSEDVQLLAERFLADLNAQYETQKTLSNSSRSFLREYSWPGNVRELKHAVQRAYILADAELVLDQAVAMQPAATDTAVRDKLEFDVGTSLAEMERQAIFATLRHCRGNKRRAAELLGCSLKTIYNRLSQYLATPDGWSQASQDA